MKKEILFYLIVVYLLCSVLYSSFSRDKQSRIFEDGNTYPYCYSYLDSAGLDSFITAKMAEHHIPGVSACIVKRGNIIWTGNYGWAYINLNIPIYDSTLFQIASVSKTVTGAALMKLYERGQFELDDSINAYLPFRVWNPYYPDSAITFKMLLTHTSSINDNWQNMPYFYNMDPPRPLGDYLDDYFTPDSMYYSIENFNNFPPGSTWEYCNIGYALAGYLVESITGIDFNEYCKDSIFAHLGMSESSFFYRDIDTMHLAMPYRWVGGNNYLAYGHYSYYDYPGGMLKTSTIQLARFLIAFMQGGRYQSVRILDSATVRLILTPIMMIPNSQYWQGLTWRRTYLGTRTLWGHSGSDNGIRTRMYFCPADTTGALLFANGETNPAYDLILNEMLNYASNYLISIRHVSSNIPSNFELYQNYPNPFNPVTRIRYDLPKTAFVKLAVYDVLGREIVVLVNEQLKPGIYEYEWDASNISSGVYFYKITASEFISVKKMILLK